MIIRRPLKQTRLLAFSITLAAIAALSVAPTVANAASLTAVPRADNTPSPKPTIVLVHGAWADSSSFGPVTQRLQQDGYTVMNAPNPLRRLQDDADYVAAFVNQSTTGPVVLVGHSYGGSVITNAATQIPRVQALVYVDAYAPDKDESVFQLTGAQPGSALAVPDPSTVFNFVQYPNAEDGDVDTYIKPDVFKDAFAAQLASVQASVLAASQRPVTLTALKDGSGDPAWKTIKSYFFVGTRDKVLPAAEQMEMATRANGVVVKANTDHLAMLEAPKAVAELIETAARTK